MACVLPLEGWYSQRLNESGKRPIVFNIRDGFSDRPVQVPCGKCIGCRFDRSRMWAIRVYHESFQHSRSAFLTLTYSDESVVAINKRDIQLFVKRLRKLCPVRYFAVGEYGSRTNRPHYHMVVFGADFMGGSFRMNDELYCNPIVQETWGKGIVSIGSVSYGSCAYVAGYTLGKLGATDTFALMSRRPGIGHDWLDKYGDDIVNTGHCVIEGRKVAVPRKYFEWEVNKLSVVKDARKRFFSSMTPDQAHKRAVSLRAKELNYKAKYANKGGEL